MATRKQAETVAARFNATVEGDPAFSYATAFAPVGKLWTANGCSEICVHYGYRGAMGEVWQEVIDFMQDGTHPAPDDYSGAWWDND